MPRRLWLSGAAVFLAASLLFVVQPLAARSLLPWYGGAPMVWAVALFFFQAVLLGGYLYAHLLVTRLAPRVQLAVHGVLLALAALASLPPLPGTGWAPDGGEAPAGWILLTLLVTLGPGFFALAATTPLVSAWVARAGPSAADDPAATGVYRLYALSNAGSLIGLAAYPLLLEPLLGLGAQGRLWSAGFVAFAALTFLAGVASVRARAGDAGRAGPPAGSRLGDFHVPAFLLAAVGSLALVAVTTHLTRDVAAVPFLWIAPLALYLLTFILAFRGGDPYPRRFLVPLLLVSVAACFYVWFQDITYGLERALLAHAVAALGFLFAGCWITHGEIVRRKPAPTRLTGFYLSMTAGGALGGLFASIGSPLLFPNVWEYPLALVLAVVVAFAVATPPRDAFRSLARKAIPAATLGVAIAISALEHRRPLTATRNFFGVVRVMEAYPGTPDWRRDMWHGGIAHGSQWFAPGRRREPTLYYYEGTGIEAVLNRHPNRRLVRPLRVAVVGLGTGSIVVHGRRGDLFRFYELDPQVVQAAREYFTFLDDAPAEVEVVLGDGRLSLLREAGAGEAEFDVIVLDAFAGDAIPVHLLTAEAFDLYQSRLAPGGTIAVHISNRHVDLAPVIRAQGLRLDLLSLLTVSDPDPDLFHYTATWVVLSLNTDLITDPSLLGRAEPWTGEAAEPADRFLWTDDHSNLLDVLR
ncbi:MAG: ferrichrome ABC transporter permease [Acidobacteria bacterium]|nr:ferrichrome ABC transporter permease [Acidobacteriota bacterium]